MGKAVVCSVISPYVYISCLDGEGCGEWALVAQGVEGLTTGGGTGLGSSPEFTKVQPR